ncbi:MAG TPA: TIM44-like domain-containing protein [Desulfoprunum sp.]|nr:TIM44-like domain-containing protein [Desulfoprunum sp.]
MLPLLLVFFAVSLIETGFVLDTADARSRGGGRSFSTAPKKAPVQNTQPGATTNRSGSFSRGLMGGLVGGALGGLLFGSMFGAPGSGMGILPILLLAGVAYFLYRKMSASRSGSSPSGAFPGSQRGPVGGGGFPMPSAPPPPPGSVASLDDGLAELQRTDRSFDPKYFTEVASDVFFQVQAGWMRRDLDSYRHLLGIQLAEEYEKEFEEMRRLGHINKLESIAIRRVEITAAGSDGREDFVTVLFLANLLDYTVDEKTNDVVTGSMTTPVKFEEEWTWARPTGTQEWRLEGVKVVNG